MSTSDFLFRWEGDVGWKTCRADDSEEVVPQPEVTVGARSIGLRVSGLKGLYCNN